MIERLGILFLHHHVDHVVKNNLRSIRLHNPDVFLTSVSAGEPLPGGHTIAPTSQLKWLHSTLHSRSSDRLVCSWYIQRQPHEICDKWWIVEWDVFCNMAIRVSDRSVWDFPFVVPSVRLPHREPEWHWFGQVREKEVKKEPRNAGGLQAIHRHGSIYCLISEGRSKHLAPILEWRLNPVGHILAEGSFEFCQRLPSRCGIILPARFSPAERQIIAGLWNVKFCPKIRSFVAACFVEIFCGMSFNAQKSGG